jgi:hypothetical protein
VPEQDEWWMIVRDDPAGPTVEAVNSLTDRFPGLSEPLRAGSGLWELANNDRDDARWRHVGDAEIAGSQDWQDFLAWLDRTAVGMRQRPNDGAPQPDEGG